MKVLTVKEYRTIQKMGPGKDLDYILAEKFFGWRPLTDDEWEITRFAIFHCRGPQGLWGTPRLMLMPWEFTDPHVGKLDYIPQSPRSWSTDNLAAREIVDTLKKDGWLLVIHEDDDKTSVTFQKPGSARVGRGDASTYAWAVSMAALSTLVENWADGTDTPEWHPAEGGE